MNDAYVCVRLRDYFRDYRDYAKIADFTIDREAEYALYPEMVIGLEAYLKKCAVLEDSNNEVRIYLILDSETKDVAAYFGLKAGMVANARDGMPSYEEKRQIMEEYGAKLLPEVAPGIEITHFAVNDNYRRRAGKNGRPIRGLGEYFYPMFIYPIIEEVADRIGVNMIYLYAAGDERLINYYTKVFDMRTLAENDCYIPLEPDYDSECTFMYRRI